VLYRYSALTNQHGVKNTRKIIILALAAVLIIVITGGYLGWTYYTSQNQNNKAPSPSVEQIRDQTMVYIEANHTETMQVMQNLNWTGGRQETGLLGAKTYLYTSGNWSLTIQYPVVVNPTYTITANYSSQTVTVDWNGTYNGTLTETSQTISVLSAPLTQEQVRDITMAYIKANHTKQLRTYYVSSGLVEEPRPRAYWAQKPTPTRVQAGLSQSSIQSYPTQPTL